jgi:mono/diheme cytochrome c family protein
MQLQGDGMAGCIETWLGKRFCLSCQGSVRRKVENMAVRFFCRVAVLIAAGVVCLPASSDAARYNKLERRGKAILQEKCGRCHAVEAVGDSPLKIAPPMRDVYTRFAPRELQAEIMHGMVSRHKEMPQIDFSEEDTAAILAYLYALAVRK